MLQCTPSSSTTDASIQPFFFHLVVGTTKVKHLDANIASLDVKLSEEELKEVSDAMPVDEIGGERDIELFTSCSWKFANTPLPATPLE